MDKELGKGQFGKVYPATEITSDTALAQLQATTGSMGNDITQPKSNAGKYFACKIAPRKVADRKNEGLIVTEIQNQDAVDSDYVVKIVKAIKTDSSYYIFMECCNAGDLKDFMDLRHFNVHPEVVRIIMKQLVTGFHDMIEVLIIHRDIKLSNLLLHFPDDEDFMMKATKAEKKEFLRNVDL